MAGNKIEPELFEHPAPILAKTFLFRQNAFHKTIHHLPPGIS
jgi:hypothetical protein